MKQYWDQTVLLRGRKRCSASRLHLVLSPEEVGGATHYPMWGWGGGGELHSSPVQRIFPGLIWDTPPPHWTRGVPSSDKTRGYLLPLDGTCPGRTRGYTGPRQDLPEEVMILSHVFKQRGKWVFHNTFNSFRLSISWWLAFDKDSARIPYQYHCNLFTFWRQQRYRCSYLTELFICILLLKFNSFLMSSLTGVMSCPSIFPISVFKNLAL